jgi:hypothetical protein
MDYTWDEHPVSRPFLVSWMRKYIDLYDVQQRERASEKTREEMMDKGEIITNEGDYKRFLDNEKGMMEYTLIYKTGAGFCLCIICRVHPNED